MVTQDQIDAVANVLVERFDPQKIILFGSYANGTATDQSDIDLLMIRDTELPRHRRLVGLGKRLAEMLVHPIDILVYTPQETEEQSDFDLAFATKIIKEGKVLYRQ